MDFEARRTSKGSYALLSGIFNLALAIFCWRRRPDQIGTRDWALLSLATFRMSRMVVYDTVMQPYRAAVVEVVPHDSGAGYTTQARYSDGFKAALGEMISCPVCNGTWISAGLVYGMCFAPNLTRTLITIMSAVGAAEILHAGFEAVQWEGELARHRAGEQMRINRAANGAAAPPAPAEPAAAPDLKIRKRA